MSGTDHNRASSDSTNLIPSSQDSFANSSFSTYQCMLGPFLSALKPQTNPHAASDLSIQAQKALHVEDREWFCFPNEEPLLPEMKAKLRVELIKYYHYCRKDVNQRQIARRNWTSEQMFSLTSTTLSPQAIGCQRLKIFCDKPRTLYWPHSAQIRGRCPLLPFRCIYYEWHRCNGHNPNIEFGHFFTNPVHITATGPPTISAILMAHKAFCEQVTGLLDKIEHGEIDRHPIARWPDPRDSNCFRSVEQ